MSTEKPRRKHSPETIAKMSEKRRARTKQPRSGTSKKAQNLYQQLKKDYKGTKNEAEILAWLEKNKAALNTTAEETRDMGILTDYHEQYPGIYEVKVGNILFGDKIDEDPEKETDPYEMTDSYDDLTENPFDE